MHIYNWLVEINAFRWFEKHDQCSSLNHMVVRQKHQYTWMDVLDNELPAVKNSTTFWTLFSMTLSSSVIVGRSPEGLMGPKVGTMLNTGATFLIPSIAIIWTNCSLVTASIPFTICSSSNEKTYYFTCEKRSNCKNYVQYQK